MQIAYSGWSYRESGPVGESHFISFNLKQFYAGTDKASDLPALEEPSARTTKD